MVPIKGTYIRVVGQDPPVRAESLPRSARAVIIGGGIAGASVAYHLAKRGWEDVVVVEQGPLWETGGAAPPAPRLVFPLNPPRAMTEPAEGAVDLYPGPQAPGRPRYHHGAGNRGATPPERAH